MAVAICLWGENRGRSIRLTDKAHRHYRSTRRAVFRKFLSVVPWSIRFLYRHGQD